MCVCRMIPSADGLVSLFVLDKYVLRCRRAPKRHTPSPSHQTVDSTNTNINQQSRQYIHFMDDILIGTTTCKMFQLYSLTLATITRYSPGMLVVRTRNLGFPSNQGEDAILYWHFSPRLLVSDCSTNLGSNPNSRLAQTEQD